MSRGNRSEQSDRSLRELGRQTAAGLDEIDEQRLASQQRRLLTSLPPRRGPSRLSWQLWLSTAAVSAAALTVVWAVWPADSIDEQELRCLDASGAEISARTWLESEAGRPSVLRFSEGSRLTLVRGTRAQLSHLGHSEVRVLVSHGRVRSEIRSAPQRRWTFMAGPYRALVVGTRFDIAWRAEARQLEISVTRGKVRVAGGNLPARGLDVEAGQRLHVDRDRSRLQRLTAPPGPDATAPDLSDRTDLSGPDLSETDLSETDLSGQGGKGGQQARRTIRKGLSGRRLDMTWKGLAQQGRHLEAVKAARGAGWRRMLAQLSGADLLLLADAARLARKIGSAQEVLLVARKRFERQYTGQVAAYRLGRLMADQKRDFRGAARWFGIFRRAAPKSALASDALAGEMLALKRVGDREGARRLARQYLTLYPRGAYAAVATQIKDTP